MTRAELARLYEENGHSVFRRCLRLLGSEAEAADALQEIFLRAYRYGDALRPGEAPLPWLCRIAERHCYDRLARRSRESPSATELAASEKACPAPPPDRTRLANQVLDACSPRVRSAAVLYYVDELTQNEVAAELQCSRKTVKEWLKRFRQTAAELVGLEPPEVAS
jgi:RNA polymerase sigma factor (sigma-70 family)